MFSVVEICVDYGGVYVFMFVFICELFMVYVFRMCVDVCSIVFFLFFS